MDLATASRASKRLQAAGKKITTVTRVAHGTRGPQAKARDALRAQRLVEGARTSGAGAGNGSDGQLAQRWRQVS